MLRLGVFLSIVLLVLGGALFLWPQDPITPSSWKMIRLGMPEKEVEAILGGPGMDSDEFHDLMESLEKKIGKYPFIVNDIFFGESDGHMGTPPKIWFGRRGRVEIQFDHENRVQSKVFLGWRSADPNVLDRLRDWLGW
jgi:hypothetical protein